MIAKEKIEKAINGFIEDTDMFVVDVKISASNQIDVFVDADSGVNIDKCIQLSREIEAAFDRDIDDFSLNVSSAGLDMPLKMPRQYKKHLGKELEVLLTDGTKYKAELTCADDESIKLQWQAKELVEGKKRKQLVNKAVEIQYTDIKTTFVIISFK